MVTTESTIVSGLPPLEDVPETPFGYKRVLDHGFVALMRVFGSDEDICNAARVSIRSGESYNDSKPRTKKDNNRLVRYLLSHGHTSPFEMAEVVFLVEAPLFVARQWMRHRTWSYNEISGRYTELPATKMYMPSSDDIHYKSGSIKQGRGEECSDEDKAFYTQGVETVYGQSQATYNIFTTPEEEESKSQGALGLDMSREIARLVLPQGTYVRFYAKADINNFLKFLGLRSKPDAQWEIQQYSNAMWELAKPQFPFVFDAWEEKIFYGMRLSRSEIATLNKILDANIGSTNRMSKKQMNLLAKIAVKSKE